MFPRWQDLGDNFWIKIHLVKILAMNFNQKYMINSYLFCKTWRLISMDLFLNDFISNKIDCKCFWSEISLRSISSNFWFQLVIIMILHLIGNNFNIFKILEIIYTWFTDWFICSLLYWILDKIKIILVQISIILIYTDLNT